MNTSKATQIAKGLGYGNVFVRANGEICMNNKSGKVILTMNPDFSVKFSRWNMATEVEALKSALSEGIAPSAVRTENNMVNSGSGFCMADTKRNWNLVNKYGYDAIEMTD